MYRFFVSKIFACNRFTVAVLNKISQPYRSILYVWGKVDSLGLGFAKTKLGN